MIPCSPLQVFIAPDTVPCGLYTKPAYLLADYVSLSHVPWGYDIMTTAESVWLVPFPYCLGEFRDSQYPFS